MRELAITLDRIPAFPPETIARDALQHGVPVVVVRDGQIVGVVGLDEVRLAAGADARQVGSVTTARGTYSAPDRSKRLS